MEGRGIGEEGWGQLPPAEAGRATLLCVIESINLMSSRREFALSDGAMKYSDRLSKTELPELPKCAKEEAEREREQICINIPSV